jgi:PIN domain nuclease of toxin-antitoxin system
MKLLLDTHALLWMLSDAPELSATAKAAISDARQDKLLSVASLWEITIKVGLQKLTLGQPLHMFFKRLEIGHFIQLLPIETEHLLRLESLSQYHRDPFDRLIIAQALSEDCTLVSSDSTLDAYGVSRLW